MADRRETIGENPLDSIISPKESEEEIEEVAATEKEEASSAEESRPSRQEESQEKQRMTVHVPRELAERIKNAVYWTPGLTVSEVAERGLRWVIEQIEEEHGGRFEERDQELKGGRPIN